MMVALGSKMDATTMGRYWGFEWLTLICFGSFSLGLMLLLGNTAGKGRGGGWGVGGGAGPAASSPMVPFVWGGRHSRQQCADIRSCGVSTRGRPHFAAPDPQPMPLLPVAPTGSLLHLLFMMLNYISSSGILPLELAPKFFHIGLGLPMYQGATGRSRGRRAIGLRGVNHAPLHSPVPLQDAEKGYLTDTRTALPLFRCTDDRAWLIRPTRDEHRHPFRLDRFLAPYRIDVHGTRGAQGPQGTEDSAGGHRCPRTRLCLCTGSGNDPGS